MGGLNGPMHEVGADEVTPAPCGTPAAPVVAPAEGAQEQAVVAGRAPASLVDAAPAARDVRERPVVLGSGDVRRRSGIPGIRRPS